MAISGRVENSGNRLGIFTQNVRELTTGGYQPAQKWLKDRRDRTLTMEEIQHYQKIVVTLMETERIMGEVDGFFELNTNEDN